MFLTDLICKTKRALHHWIILVLYIVNADLPPIMLLCNFFLPQKDTPYGKKNSQISLNPLEKIQSLKVKASKPKLQQKSKNGARLQNPCFTTSPAVSGDGPNTLVMLFMFFCRLLLAQDEAGGQRREEQRFTSAVPTLC